MEIKIWIRDREMRLKSSVDAGLDVGTDKQT